MTDRPQYSIIAPVYNEEGNLDVLYTRLSAVMDSTGEPWELVLVNDGSRDRSMDMMDALAAKDTRVKVIHFARNFGHQTAVTAGIDYSIGHAVVIIDADLQDPPELILDMIERWKAGFQVVYAVRASRKGESWFKLFSAKLFYRVIYRITDVDIPVDTGDFRLMDEKVIAVLKQMREHNRFIRGMTSWVGFKQTGVLYERQERFAGVTKYPISKMVRFALDAITSFSYFPLQIMLYVSLTLGVIALVGMLIVAILRIVEGATFFGGQATTICLLLLMSSFQLFFLFILGQYVARIYDEVRGRPLYVVASTSNTGAAASSGEASLRSVPEMRTAALEMQGMLNMEDSGKELREQVEEYRRVVELYESLDAEIDALIMRYDGASENMPPEDLRNYRALAERRDEAYNTMRVYEQNLLSDEDSATG